MDSIADDIVEPKNVKNINLNQDVLLSLVEVFTSTEFKQTFSVEVNIPRSVLQVGLGEGIFPIGKNSCCHFYREVDTEEYSLFTRCRAVFFEASDGIWENFSVLFQDSTDEEYNTRCIDNWEIGSKRPKNYAMFQHCVEGPQYISSISQRFT